MNEIASKGQLRLSFLRWAVVTVPLVVLLGLGAGRLVQSGEDNAWYAALVRPDITPPGWLFGVAWTTLYILLGLAIAVVLHARGARGRGPAITLFVVQLALNLVWSPLFFGAHQVTLGFWLIVTILVLAIATTFAFGRVRSLAAWLMVPYLLWLSFASILNFQFDQLNPDAETLVISRASTQVPL